MRISIRSRHALAALAISCTACGMVAGLERDQKRFERYRPAGPGVEAGARGAVRQARHVLRVRVYADASYRRETIEWREHIGRQFDDVNVELAAWFDARVEVVEVVAWDHDAPTDDLHAVLGALRREAPEPDVDRVVAMTSPLATLSVSQDQLGLAEILGQHLVVRRMNDHAERDALRGQFELASDAERDALYVARIRHKEATVLLHELAHTLGGLHARAQGMIMSPVYTHTAREFTPTNERTIQRALELRDEHAGAPHGVWRDAALEATRARVRADAAADRDLSARAGDALLRRDPDALTGAEVARLDEVRADLAARRALEAWAGLAELREARPEHPAVAVLSCAALEGERRAGRDRPDALLTWCERAHAKEPTDAYVASVLATAYERAGRAPDALAMARKIEPILTARGDASNDWIVLSGVYYSLGALTLAERALARAGMRRDAGAFKEAIATRRGHLALDPALAPEVAIEVVPKLDALDDAIRAKDAKTRDALLAEITALNPEGTSTLLARCRVSYARRSKKRSLRDCEAAYQAAPEHAGVHFHYAYALAASGKLDAALARAERAVALAPQVKAYWNVQGWLLGLKRREEALGAWRERYTERFGAAPEW
jgi:tetratricopeptide (TPR) repeat protein